MDCNDCCEKITQLAEQVANGADLNEILPEMKKFMHYWGDCREEFEALVAVIQREKALEGIRLFRPARLARLIRQPEASSLRARIAQQIAPL